MGGQVASNFRQGRGGAKSGRATECGLRCRYDLPPATSCQDRNRAQHVFRGEGGARRQEGPATGGRIPPQSADNAKTGLNRGFFGTLAPARRPSASPRPQPPDATGRGVPPEARSARRGRTQRFGGRPLYAWRGIGRTTYFEMRAANAAPLMVSSMQLP